MADLSKLEPSEPSTQTYQGVIVNTAAVGTVLGVNVNGNVLPAQWADPLVVTVGDTVMVEITGAATGQGAAFVKSRLAMNPRPPQGTISTVPPGSPTVTVTGTDGAAYAATFVSSYTPAVNDIVILSWNASQPTVLGKVGSVALPPPPPPPVAQQAVLPPPPPPITGTSYYPATDSDTIWPAGGWGSWGGGGGHVYQGSYGSGPIYGSWFYGGSTTEMSGRVITRIQIRLGSRRRVGSYNLPVAAHFYAHLSPNKPGGDVNRIAGPFDVTIQPGAGQQTVDLPNWMGDALMAGGGICIAGDPYMGFEGRYTQPDSGTLTIDWSR